MAAPLSLMRAAVSVGYRSRRLVLSVQRVSAGRCCFSNEICQPSAGVLRASGTRRRLPTVTPAAGLRLYATENAAAAEPAEPAESYHNIIKSTERGKGPAQRREFQAETKKLLDIVARSLYSEKEVFIRELISNSSDAVERMRYLEATGADVGDKGTALEIHIATDDAKKTFTIQDTGVGMTKEEMIENLGTIAKSGSKAFIEQVAQGQSAANNIIGQFGVGFYSTFMVGDRVDVYSRSCQPGSVAHKWHSDGSGSYDIAEAEGVQRGTKVIVHLKGDCYDFAKEETIKEICKKYSNFVGVPIYLNGTRVNASQALWMRETRDINDQMHEEFYQLIGGAQDKPRYSLHYKADGPLNIRALFYVPEHKPTLFDMSRETDVGVALYSRKVMILPKANHILPKWLRFLKGVVDSEDIPLNLSRELLQDGALIRKLRWVLTNRILKFLHDQSKKDLEKYLVFYQDYGMFFREGIVTNHEQETKEEIAKLMRFETSALPAGELTSLQDYAGRMAAGERNIYYLTAPSRELAETSPYYEAMKERDREVIFCYEPYDELVLLHLGQFDKKTLKSIEGQMEAAKDKTSGDSASSAAQDSDSLQAAEAESLTDWLKDVLGAKVKEVKVTKQLVSHPCALSLAEMGAVRHVMRTTFANVSSDDRIRMLQATFEVNPRHAVIKKLSGLRTQDPELAKLVAEQLFDNSLINAGLMDNPRSIVGRLNMILEKALAKH